MNWRITATWILILIILALGIYMVAWTKSESFTCLSNPYVYSIKLLEKSNHAEVTATVQVMKPNGATMLLTRNGFSPINVVSQNVSYQTNWNLSLINFSK